MTLIPFDQIEMKFYIMPSLLEKAAKEAAEGLKKEKEEDELILR